MALGSISGKPGTLTGYSANPIDIFYSSRADAKFIPGPCTVDGTVSGNALNTPYVWLLQAGMLMGRDTTSGKFETAIIGKSTAVYNSGDTTLTVGAATAVEIVRRVGASGSLKLIGPPNAAGTVAVSSVTFSAVNTTSGAITVTNIGVNKVTDSLVSAADGSHVPVTVICDQFGVKVVDAVFTSRVDVFDAELWAGGGIIDGSRLLNWPGDVSTQSWIKTNLRTYIPDAKFKDDLINA